MRSQWFFKSLYFIVSISSIVVIGRLFSGQTYIRQAPLLKSVSDSDETVSAEKLSDIWPFKMRLSMFNYVDGKGPDPNFDTADEDLIAVWHLPPKSRLSPSMRKIAHCELFAKAIVNRTDIVFDANDCRRVEPWPCLILMTAVLCAVFNLFRTLFGFSIDKQLVKDRADFQRLIVIAFFQLLLVGVSVIIIISHVIGDLSLGLVYTPYFEVDPVEYYSASADWYEIISLLMLTNFLVNSVEFFIYSAILYSCPGIGTKLKDWINMS